MANKSPNARTIHDWSVRLSKAQEKIGEGRFALTLDGGKIYIIHWVQPPMGYEDCKVVFHGIADDADAALDRYIAGYRVNAGPHAVAAE